MKPIEVKVKNGLTIAFKQFGHTGKCYVLLHGIPGSSQSWQQVAEILSSRGARVLVPDLLGFGKSSRPSDISTLWLNTQADALAEGLRLLDVRNFHLVGHDYGGPVSITLYDLMADEINNLSLLATNTFTDTPIPAPLALIKVPLLGFLWSKIIFSRLSLGMMLKQGVGDSKSLRPDIEAALGDQQQSDAIATIFKTALSELSQRYLFVENQLPKLRLPVKVIWGTKDPFFSIAQGKRTAAAIPGAEFIILNGAGHFLPEERPGEIADLLLQSEKFNQSS